VVEVLREVTVDVEDRLGDVHPHQLLDVAPDACLLEDLTHRRPRGMLAGVDDAGHGRPHPVVGTPHQEHLVVMDDDGGDPRQPQQVVAHVLPQAEDEVGHGHVPTVGAPERSRRAATAGQVELICR
jgi:hypothetical protein